jgi:hypothetical protein
MKKIIYIFLVLFLFLSSCEKQDLLASTASMSLISVQNESSGNNCISGGFRIETGIDTNNNGILNANEIQAISYVCNGNNGENRLQSLIKVSDELAGNKCISGGFKIETGIDINSNSVLDLNEIQSTNYICNGSKGDNGSNGSNGANGLQSLINIVAEMAGDNCRYGGFKIEIGIDINSNKTLDTNEIQSTNYICNSTDNSPVNTDLKIYHDIEMFLSGGQSLNVWSDASNSLTDFKNTPSFALGSSLAYRNFNTQAEKDAFFGTKFVKLKENDVNEQYPAVTASLTTILNLLEKENNVDVTTFGYQMMPFTWGVSGSSIITMTKGTIPYNRMIESVIKAKEFANKEGKTFGVRSMNWYHGEQDNEQTKQWYYDRQSQLFIDVNTDIKLITGQSEDLQFFTYQTSPWLGRDLGSGVMTQMNIQEAQVQVATDFENVHVSGAMYQFGYRDMYHPLDMATVGLQTGVAMKRVLLDNKTWIDFKPLSHKVITDGTNYYTHLKFDVPVKPARFDISGDTWHNPNGQQQNFGFELLSSGIEKQTATPFITIGDTVVLTSSENPTGMTIRYAVNGHAGGGNLCDSQNIITRNKGIDYTIDNFAVGFSEYLID